MSCTNEQLAKLLPAADFAYIMDPANGKTPTEGLAKLRKDLEVDQQKFLDSVEANQETKDLLVGSLAPLDTKNLVDTFSDSKFKVVGSPEDAEEVLSTDVAYSQQLGPTKNQLKALETVTFPDKPKQQEGFDKKLVDWTKELEDLTKVLVETNSEHPDRRKNIRKLEALVKKINNDYTQYKDFNAPYRKEVKRFLNRKAVKSKITPELREAITQLINTDANSHKQAAEAKAIIKPALDAVKDGNPDQKALLADMLPKRLKYYSKYSVDSAAIYSKDKIDSQYTHSLKGILTGIFGGVEDIAKDFVSDGINVSLYQVKEKARSLLGALPDTHQFLATPETRDTLLGASASPKLKVGIDNFLVLRDLVQFALEKELLSDVIGEEEGELGMSYTNAKGVTKEPGALFVQSINDAPFHFFRNKTELGKLPSNLVTAIAAELQSWLHENASESLYNDEDRVASMLSLNGRSELKKGAYEGLRDKGILQKNVIEQLGKGIYKHLNLKTIEGSSATLQENLQTSLGMLALEAGYKMQWFQNAQETQVSLSQWNYWQDKTDTVDPDDKTKVKLVRAASKKVGEIPQLADLPRQTVSTYADISPLFEELFDMRDRNNKQVDTPNPKAKTNIKGIINDVSASAQDAERTLQKTPFIPHNGMRTSFNQMSKQDYMERVMGWVDPLTLNVNHRDSQAGKNLGIERNYNALKSYFDSNTDNSPMYYNWTVSKNMRSSIDSNALNYQSNHLHRAATINPKWESTIQLNDDKQSIEDLNDFKVATGLWMDIGVDKAVEDDKLFEEIDAYMESAPIKPAWEMLITKNNTEAYTPEELSILTTAIKQKGEGPHVLAALIAWSQYKAAERNGDTSFSHVNIMEVDGLTNGLAISLMQTPAATTEEERRHLRDLLNRVGVYFKRNNYKDEDGNTRYIESYAEALVRNKKLQDNYQDVAKRIGFYVQDILNGKNIDRVKTPDAFDSEKKFRAGRANAVQEKLSASNLKLLMPDFLAKDQKTLKKTRSLAKDPVIKGNYSAGQESVGYEISRTPYNTVIDSLMDIANSSKLSEEAKIVKMQGYLKKVDEVLASYGETKQAYKNAGLKYQEGDYLFPETGTGFKATNKFTPEFIAKSENAQGDTGALAFAKEFTLPPAQVDLLTSRTESVYGKAAFSALKDILGKQWEVRDQITTAILIMNRVYVQLREKAIKDWSKTHAKNPTAEDEQAIDVELRNQGLLPGFRHPGSDPFDPNNPNYSTHLEVTNTSWKLLERQMDDGTPYAAELRSKYGFSNNGKSISRQLQRLSPDDQVKVKGYVLAIQSMDAHIMHQLILARGDKLDISHIFDAFMSNLKDNKAIAELADSIFYKENKKYNLVEEVQTSLKRFEEAVGDNALSEKEIAKIYDGIEDIDDTGYSPFFGETVKRVNDERTKLYGKNGVLASNQYSRSGTAYIVPAAINSSNAENIASSPASTLGSTSQSPDINAPGDREVTTLEADKVQEIYAGMKEYENQILDSDHEEQLDAVVKDIIVPGFANADDTIEQVFIRNPDQARNLGEYDPNTHQVIIEASKNQINNPINMSLQETAVHEWIHAVLVPALEHDYWGKNELLKLFNRAKETVVPEDFINRDKNGNIIGNAQHAREAAETYWKYIFENARGHNLHEFAAIGLTNKPFAQALSRIDFDPEADNEGSVWDWSAPLKSLWNLLVKALEWQSNKTYEARNGKLHEGLVNLAKAAVASNNNQQTKLREVTRTAEDSAIAFMGQANEFITGNAKKAATKAVELATGVKFARNPDVAELQKTITTGLLGDQIDKASARVQEQLQGRGVGVANFASDLTQEIAGLAKKNQHWRAIKIASLQNIDAQRKRISDNVTEAVQEAFDPAVKLSKSTWQAINDVVLKSDLVTLTKAFSMDQIIELLESPNTVATSIREYEQRLKKDFGDRNGIFYSNSAHILGRLIMTGIVGDNVYNPMTNAENIVKMLALPQSQRKTVGDLENAQEIVDQLASLRAIQYMDGNQKREALEVFRHEHSRKDANGISMLMTYHDAFKSMSQAENFTEGLTSTWKGHTSQNFDQRISVETAPITPLVEEDMLRAGFVLLHKLPRDRTDSHSPPLGLYVSSIGQDTYKKGIVSLTSTQRRGSDLSDILANSLKQYSTSDLKQTFSKIHQKNMNLAKNLFDSKLDVLKSTEGKLIPVVSPKTEGIVNYRYIMSEENKKNILKNDQQAHQTIGRMFGSISDKAKTPEINKTVLEGWKQDWEANGEKGSNKFRYLSATSPDLEAREAFFMLPEELRYEASKYFGGKNPTIPIRKEMFMYILGNREVSIAGKLQQTNITGKTKIPLRALNAIRVSEEIWKEIVNFARMKSSVLLPDVVFTNMFSNIMVLAADGIPPSFMKKNMGEAIHAMRKFQKNRKELDRLNIEIVGRQQKGENVTKLVARQNFLTNQLNDNPVKEMIDEGLFSAIVEDISATSYEAKQQTHITNLFEKIPEYAKEKLGADKEGNVDQTMSIVREGLMNPGSKLFAMAMAANQYGDFVARYIKFKYDTQVNKMDRRDAINESLDAFIFYDEPTSKAMQVANDYGFVMFTKFYLRIQRVLLKLFMEKPANMIGIYTMQEMITPVPDIADDIMSVDGLLNRMHLNPFDTFFKATGMPIIEWAKYPFSLAAKAL